MALILPSSLLGARGSENDLIWGLGGGGMVLTAVRVICASAGKAGRSGNAVSGDLGGGGMDPKPCVGQLEEGPAETSAPSILMSAPVT